MHAIHSAQPRDVRGVLVPSHSNNTINGTNEPQKERERKKRNTRGDNLHEVPSRTANPHSRAAQASPPSRAAARDRAVPRANGQIYEPPLQVPRASLPEQRCHPGMQSRALPAPCSARRTVRVCRASGRAESTGEMQPPRSLP
jgi:hypothetical protein